MSTGFDLYWASLPVVDRATIQTPTKDRMRVAFQTAEIMERKRQVRLDRLVTLAVGVIQNIGSEYVVDPKQVAERSLALLAALENQT